MTTFQIMMSAKFAGSVVRYRIKVLSKRPADQLVFDELWIEDRLQHIRITREEAAESTEGKGQIIYIDSVSDIRYPFLPIPSMQEETKTKILLGYQIGKKRKYLPIKEFSVCHPQLS